MAFRSLFKQQKKDHLVQVVNTFATIPLLDFALVYFENKKHTPPKRRPWIAFRFEESTLCVVKTVTSRPNSIGNFYKFDENGAKSIVWISENEFNPPLDRISYIDCNIKALDYVTYKELAYEIINWDKGLEKSEHKIPENIKQRIIRAIINSRHTPEDVKKAFRDRYEL